MTKRDEENTLGREVESQRRFLSKLANDLAIHDVCSLSLSDFFSQLIFRYFRFIISHPFSFFLMHLLFCSSSEFRMVQHF